MCSLRRLLLTTTRRVPPSRKCVLSVRNNENVGAIHSTKIQTGPTGKSGPPQRVDQFFRNFSGWTEPIHWVLDRNFRKFWLNGSRLIGSLSKKGEVHQRDILTRAGRATRVDCLARLQSYWFCRHIWFVSEHGLLFPLALRAWVWGRHSIDSVSTHS